jgi:hypothetical protein
LLAALLCRSLSAQASDSATGRPVYNNHAGVALGLIAGTAVLAIAPSAAMLLPSDEGPPEYPLPRDVLIASFVGGGTGRDAPSAWTSAEWIELRQDHVYLSAERMRVSGDAPVGFETLQAGYRARPTGHPRLEGGVTLGYRHATGPGVQDAAVLAFPALVGSSLAAMRFEPTYVFSASGVHWTYRFSGEFYSLPSPLFAGIRLEAKPLRQGDPYVGTVAFLLGVRR